MNLQHLTDECLLTSTEKLVREEREILTSVLHHLREIERRRLFSSLHFSSLFEYAVKKLGYSEDQACRRIAAMRLIKELPEVEEKLNSGSLSLTHVGLAQSLFKKEKKLANREFSRNEKVQILDQLQDTSTRQAERIVLSLSSVPAQIKQDKVRAITPELIELRLTADKDLQEKIERLKGLLAHAQPDISLGELFNKLCDLGLKTWDKGRTPVRTARQPTSTNSAEQKETYTKHPVSPAAPRVDRIAAATKRLVWQKAKGQCQNCSSGFALEIDHVTPHSMGGGSDQNNLRLLCRSCNQRSAIEKLGLHKMEAHINNKFNAALN